MQPSEKCPVCGGNLVEKEVEKILRGGVNTSVLKICAEVCLRCGGRLYSQGTVRRFEQVRAKLERQDTKEFRAIGVSYQVAYDKRLDPSTDSATSISPDHAFSPPPACRAFRALSSPSARRAHVHACARRGAGGRSSLGLNEGAGQLGRAAFWRRNSEKHFEKDFACGGQFVGETESSCVAAAASMRVCADVCQRSWERLFTQDTGRRFEEIRDSGWGSWNR